MPDGGPTDKQTWVAEHGTDTEKRALARDPGVSDAVRLLFVGAPPDLRDLALGNAEADATIISLLGPDPPEWLLKHAASCVKSEETLLNTPIFAESTSASVLAAMAERFDSDRHRTKYLADEHATVRGATIRAMKDPDILEAHLANETAPRLIKDCKARIDHLRANPQLQGSKAQQPGAPGRASVSGPPTGLVL